MRSAQKPWTPPDDDQLRREFEAGTPLAEIVSKTGRTEAAIKNRAYILRLKIGLLRKPGQSREAGG